MLEPSHTTSLLISYFYVVLDAVSPFLTVCHSHITRQRPTVAAFNNPPTPAPLHVRKAHHLLQYNKMASSAFLVIDIT